MITLIILSFIFSITFSMIQKKYTNYYSFKGHKQQKVVQKSKQKEEGKFQNLQSNSEDQAKSKKQETVANLMDYYSNLKFNEVNDLQFIPVDVQFPVQTYKQNQKIFYQNYEKLQQKVKAMQKINNEDIQVLADFDHTVSSREINGKFNVPTMGIFRESEILPREFRDQLSQLFNYYYPIEKDVNIPENEKIRLVEEWYNKDNEITSKQNITLEVIKDVLNCANVGFRNKAPEFLKLCKRNKINLSVVSGGCSDYIVTMINQQIKLHDYEQFKIYANEVIIENDKLMKYDMKMNSVGKKLVINNKKLQGRKNIILFGDILADVNMVSNVKYDNLISVGFLNKPRSQDDLGQYLEKYDMVIVNDGSFEEPNKLLTKIFQE